MITREKFDFIKEKYGHHASWAVWAEPADTSKTNMGDLTILDPEINKDLLFQLNPNIILVALNFSMEVKHEPWGNFHSDGQHRQDYKARYALKDSQYWGGYMTDILKDYPELESGKVMAYLRKNPSFELKNVKSFLQELKDLDSKNPIIIAFGSIVYEILKKNLPDHNIQKITHYAHHVNLEKYREEVLKL